MSESFDEFQPAPNEWDEFQPANPGPSTRDVLKAVSSIDPAQASKASKLAKKYNAADEVLLRTLQDAEMVDRINTATTKLDKAPVLADYMRNSPFVTAQAQKDIDPLVKMNEQMRAPRTALGTLGDVGVTALKGVVGLPQSLVGLVDIPTLGGFGKDLETLGVRFKDTQNFLSSLYSPAQQQANQAVSEADGFVGTLGAMLQNPSTIATTVGQSAPQMLGGAAIGRGLVAVAPRVAPWLSAALGEGIISAGGAAEQTREQTDDGRLSVKQSLSAVASGGGTALFGAVGGKVSQRLGLADIDTALVARGVDKTSAQAAKTGFIAAVTKAGVSEGVFEELPQSVQEQMWQNYANDRPINEGVGAAAAQGLLAGLSMGSGFQVLAEGGQRIAARAQQADAAAQDAAKLQNLMASAAEATLRQNNPETFAQLVQHMADNTEGAPKSVYIDAQVFNQAVQTLTPEQLAQAFPSVTPEQIAEAVTTNSTVEVPIGEALAAVPGTPLEQVFLQNARSAPDALSLADAQTQGEQAAEWIKTEAERVLQQAQDQTTWQTSSEGVRTTILDQLNQAGRFTPEVNEAYALLQANFFSTMAARTGVTPQEMYDRFSLKVAAGQNAADAGSLEQGSTLDDVRQQWADAGIKHAVTESRGRLTLSQIIVPDTERSSGKGTAAMQALVDYADRTGQRVELSPSADFGGNKKRLVEFYKRFGFVENKGRNKDYEVSESMYRPAQALNQSPQSLPPTIEIDGKQRPTTNSNGQPIASTEGGVRNFWKWFGDSKVVDDQGRPLVVYHGTTRGGFTEFKLHERSRSAGFVFTSDKSLALTYSGQNNNAEPGPRSTKAGVYEAYIKSENLESVDWGGAHFGDNGGTDAAIAKAKEAGFDGVVMRNVDDPGAHKRMLVNRGEIPDETGVGDIYAVFNPTQIKSAIGNSGEFDPANPNILMQSVGSAQVDELTGLPLNPDGTVTVYHHTSADKAVQISKTGKLKSAAEPDVYVTTRKETDTGYGDTAVAIRVNPELLQIDDEFPDGRVDYRIATGKPGGSIAVKVGEYAGGQYNQQARGTFNPQSLLISLNENANLSTFLHESGHFFLEVMADLAGQPNAPADVAADMDKLLAWFGIKGDETVGGADSGVPLAQGRKTSAGLRLWHGSPDPTWVDRGEAFDPTRMINAPSKYQFLTPHVNVAETYAGISEMQRWKAENGMGSAPAPTAGVREFVLSKSAKLLKVKDVKKAATKLGTEWAGDNPLEALLDAAKAAGYDAVQMEVDGGNVAVLNPAVLGRPQTLAQDGNLPIDDTQPVRRTPLETWNAMTLDQKRQYHEKFAESFEAYLLEGKAPSAELQPLFRRFRSWLVNVYKSLKEFMRGRDLNMNDEVRQVFDRMLATDEQIAAAEEAAGMLPDFDATNEAIEKLQARSLRDLKWTVGARSKALKALQKEAANLRKAVEAEVREEIEAAPEMRAKAALDNLRKQNKKAPTDLEIATVADSFGYPTVDAMLQAIDAFGPKKDAIEGLTDRRMLENFGELATPEAIEEAANDAVHNEARARSLATELKAQAEALNPREDTGRTASNGRPITVNALQAAAKEFAENLVARRKVKDLKNAAWQHRAAEARAGKAWQEATAKGKTQEAVQAKRDQMLNNYAAKAMGEAQAEVKKILDFFARVTKGNNEKTVERGRDPDVVNAARAILAAYEIAPRLEKGALEYLAVLEKNDPTMYAALQPSIAGAVNNAKPVGEMSMEELRGLKDEIDAMWHLAKRSRQMEVDGNLLDIEDAASELQERMQEIGVPDTMPGDARAITNAEKRARWLQHAGSLLRRAEQWAEGMDGKFGGPFLRLVFQPVKEAANRYRADRVKYRKAYQVLVDNVAPALRKGTIAAPELGYTFGEGHNGIGHAELLHAILHTGNESNKRKLLLGRRWATENADGTLDTSRWDAFVTRMQNEGILAKEHYDFAQGVWDLLEQTKPLAQKTHRDVFGRYFAEVTADSFETPFGTYRGGYVPAQADPRIVQDADLRKLAELENENMAYSFPATNKGFTKGRVEYNRPLLLDLRTIGQHIDKVLLFSHMEPAVRDVNKLLSQKGVSYSLSRIDPTIYAGMLTPWLSRSARQIVETPILGDGGISRVLSAARSRAGMALMFANVSNAIQQITGFSNAFAKLKADGLKSQMMRATVQFIASPREMSRSVAQASSFMNNRMENEIAAINDAMDAILLDPSLFERTQAWTQKHAYFLQTAFANTMEPIIWTAGYNAALEKGMSEKDAVRYADALIRQTQGSTLPEDVSRIETGPAYGRMFTQFIGYFNNMANTNATALKQIAQDVGLRKGAGKALLIVTTGMLVPLWIAEAIAQAMRGGPDDEDDDGYLDDWLAAVFGMGTIKGAFAMVPFIGQFANVALNKMNGNPADDRASLSPAVSLLEAGAGVPKLVYQAITDPDKVNARNAVRDVASALSIATGIPVYALARPLGYLAGVADDKIEPTGPVDAVRGVVTGTPSEESRVR